MPKPFVTLCPNGVCSKENCCKKRVSCASYSCPMDMKYKANYASIYGSTDEACCDDAPVCKSYNCPSGYKHKVSSETMRGDSSDACCEVKTCNGRPQTCTAQGDPHFVTFNGVKHNAQGKVEFVLADFATTNCGKVEIHTCHKA